MKCRLLECAPPQSSGRPPPRGCRSGSGLPASLPPGLGWAAAPGGALIGPAEPPGVHAGSAGRSACLGASGFCGHRV